MNFFTALLISVIITTVIVCIAWRFIIAIFRAKVCTLMYYNAWFRIDREVSKFILKVHEKDCKIYYDGLIILGHNGNIVDLNIRDVEVMKILYHDHLFDSRLVDLTRCEIVPNAGFSKVAEVAKREILKTSEVLHKRFDNYPWLVQNYLYGANNLLLEIEEGLNQ